MEMIHIFKRYDCVLIHAYKRGFARVHYVRHLDYISTTILAGRSDISIKIFLHDQK